MYKDIFRNTALFTFRTIYANSKEELVEIYDEMINYDLSNLDTEDKELFQLVLESVRICKISLEKISELYVPNDSTNKVIPIKRFKDTTEYGYEELLEKYTESLRLLQSLHISFAGGYIDGVLDGMKAIK